jgi:predicted O-methyltransferase YrrM
MRDLSGLFASIAAQHPEGVWTSLEKAQTMASLVVALRPRLIIEIGIWEGDSIMPMLLALKHVGSGTAIAIDPWAAAASVADQGDADREWWAKAPHDEALAKFTTRMVRAEVNGICQVLRQKSDDVDPKVIGEADIVHIDGNHKETATRDVLRFAPLVPVGGVLVLDDLDWSGSHVRAGYEHALLMGFVQAYPLGTGCVMVRRSHGA